LKLYAGNLNNLHKMQQSLVYWPIINDNTESTVELSRRHRCELELLTSATIQWWNWHCDITQLCTDLA